MIQKRLEVRIEDKSVFAAIGGRRAVLPHPLDVRLWPTVFMLEEVCTRRRRSCDEEKHSSELEMAAHWMTAYPRGESPLILLV